MKVRGALIRWGIGCVALLWAVSAFVPARAEAPRAAQVQPVVLVVPIEGMIDLGLAPFVDRVLQTAAQENAAAVLLEINTFGGRVDAAVAIRDHLLRAQVPTVAFVNKRAISAGALIGMAAETVVMAHGATIGAATPVQMGQPDEGPKPVDEKTVSYVRKEFRATADARNRPGLIAEAMVDPDVEIKGVIEKGKLLTLTTDEAMEHKIADFVADDLTAVLATLHLAGAELRPMTLNWAERVVRFLTNPVVSSLLMTLGILGLVVELRTPGFGVPGAIGVLAFAAFFWGHWLVELVGWEEVLLMAAGVILLILEIFVFPGFGVAGALGIAAIVAGLSLSLFGSGPSVQVVVSAVARVLISAALALGASLLLLRLFPALPMARRLVLSTVLPGLVPPPDAEKPAQATLVGKTGTTITPLRPAGIADINGRRVDVVSRGEFIDPGVDVVVVIEEGHRVVVKPTSSS